MYEIHIESEEFREKRTVQQHQMVNQVRGLWGLPWGTGGERMAVREQEQLEWVRGTHQSWPCRDTPKPHPGSSVQTFLALWGHARSLGSLGSV